MNKQVEKLVNEYNSKYEEGLLSEEIADIKKNFDLSEKHFVKAMIGNTCLFRDGRIIIFRDDVIKAIMCGIERRGLKPYEFD